jgi:hypothetical protein
MTFKVCAILATALGLLAYATPVVAALPPSPVVAPAAIRVRGEINFFLSMQGGPSYLRVKTPNGQSYWALLTKKEMDNPKFEVAFAICDFELIRTEETLPDLEQGALYLIRSQQNCKSTLK